MKKTALAILIGLLGMVSASAGTLTITASGFATTSASAPPGWPAGVTWPGNQSANGTKTYTVSDADWASLMAWTAASQFPVPSSPSAGAILLAWVQVWINGTKNAVAQYYTTPPTVPPPITIQ